MQIALPNTQTFEKKEPLYTNEETSFTASIRKWISKINFSWRCDEKPETGTKTRWNLITRSNGMS